MNSPTPRTKPAAQRRADLLDAAEKLALENGADGFTVDDVVGGAGVAKGTFYLHFSNKADLINALRERYGERFAERQHSHASAAAGVDGILAWMHSGIDEYLRDVRLHDVLFHPITRHDGGVNKSVETLTGLLTDLADPPADPWATATILYSAMHGVTDHIIHDPASSQRLRDALDRTIRALLS